MKEHSASVILPLVHQTLSSRMNTQDQAETLLHLCRDAVYEKEEDAALLALEKFLSLRLDTKDTKHGVARLFMATLTYQMPLLTQTLQNECASAITSFASHVLIKSYLSHTGLVRPLTDPSVTSDINTVLSVFDKPNHKEKFAPQTIPTLFAHLSLSQLKQLYQQDLGKGWELEYSTALIDTFIQDPQKYDWAQENQLLESSFEQIGDCGLLRSVVAHCCFASQNNPQQSFQFLKRIAPLYSTKTLMDVTISHPDNIVRSSLLDRLAQQDAILAEDIVDQLGKKLAQNSLRKVLPYLTSLYDKRQLLKKVRLSEHPRKEKKTKKM